MKNNLSKLLSLLLCLTLCLSLLPAGAAWAEEPEAGTATGTGAVQKVLPEEIAKERELLYKIEAPYIEEPEPTVVVTLTTEEQQGTVETASTSGASLSAAEVTAKLDEIKSSTYPADSYYTGSFGGGIECYAFGRLLANEVFGSYPWNCSAYSDGYTDANGWSLIIGPSESTGIEPGDIIEVRNTGTHTAIVWKLSGSTIYVAECWGSQGGKVAWGYFNGSSANSTLSGLIDTYGQSNVYVWKRPGASSTSTGVPINESNFPDPIFRAYISENFDSDSNGLLSEAEIANVTSITCDGLGLTSLEGIALFPNLTSLECNDNQLTALDVSQNPKLDFLSCIDNQLTELDVSKNPELSILQCGANQLTALDVSQNPKLYWLLCRENQLTELDVSKNTALTTLDCDANQLTKLYVSSNPALETLCCCENQLTALDVSKNTALETLYCWTNQLTELDVSKNTVLTILDCNSNQLTALDVSQNPKLYWFSCWDNQLTELDVSNNTALEMLYCNENQLSALDISNNTSLEELLCWENQLTELDVSKNTALTTLDCDANQLTALDVSQNLKLSWLSCIDNQLTELDVSNNTALEMLCCNENQLTALDVTKNTALTELYCRDNQLTALDVSNNTSLTYLDCSGCGLGSLDVSNNTELLYLYCGALTYPNSELYKRNYLTELDLSNNTKLIELYCGYNELSDLDLSGMKALESLSCSKNPLTSLDVSNNPELQTLYCYSNQLTELDVTNNPALETLLCWDNQLAELDVSKNTALTTLDCELNQLTALDVSCSPALETLYCCNNHLTTLDLSNNTKLQTVECGEQTLPAQSFTQNGEKYLFDLSALVGAENIGRITSVETGDYDPETGIASFDAPGSFTYYYSTGYGDTLMDVSCGEETESTGAALTGTAISWDGNGNELICLYSGLTEDEVKADIASGASGARYTAQCGEAVQNADGKRYDVSFSFDDVEAGEYILAIYKPGNYTLVTRAVTVSGDVGLGELALQLTGDVSGDGKVNTMDLIRLMKYISGVEVDMAEGAGDVNGDGKVNTMDLIRLMKLANGEIV